MDETSGISKKSQEFSIDKKDVGDFIQEILNLLGIPGFPWAENIMSISSFLDQSSKNHIFHDIYIIETKEEVLINMKTTGVTNRNDLSIHLRNNTLYVAVKTCHLQVNDSDSREIRLPVNVFGSGGEARFRDGNLTVLLPKKIAEEEDTPVRVEET